MVADSQRHTSGHHECHGAHRAEMTSVVVGTVGAAVAAPWHSHWLQ